MAEEEIVEEAAPFSQNHSKIEDRLVNEVNVQTAYRVILNLSLLQNWGKLKLKLSIGSRLKYSINSSVVMKFPRYPSPLWIFFAFICLHH